jgi:hypothetical protein
MALAHGGISGTLSGHGTVTVDPECSEGEQYGTIPLSASRREEVRRAVCAIGRIGKCHPTRSIRALSISRFQPRSLQLQVQYC